MFGPRRLSVHTLAIDCEFSDKTFFSCEENLFGLYICFTEQFLWWFDFAFLIFLLHLFLKVLCDFQLSPDLGFLDFLNVWWRLFIKFLLSISSHGHGISFPRFSIWGECVLKTSRKEDVKYNKSTWTGNQLILATSGFSS